MITDRELTFSDGQAITATANSTDVISLDGYRIGRGQNLRFYVQIDEAFTADGAATLNVEFVQADNAALTTNAEVLYATGVKALAALGKTPKKFFVDVPAPANTRNFAGVKYTVATGPMTAGKITAGIVIDTPTALDDRPVYNTGF